MRRFNVFLAVAAVACLTLPALAQSTPVDDKNGKITNTIGAAGAGEANNGNGKASYNAGVWEINGGGGGLWAEADGMTFVSTALEGDGNITARILDERGGSGDGWMRTGVLIRENDEGPGIYAGQFNANEDSNVPRGRHLHVHYRFENAGATVWGGDSGPWGPEGNRPGTDGGVGLRVFPMWLRAQRVGNVVTMLRSDDGKIWEMTSKPQEVALPATARVGIEVSSDGGAADTLGTAHFDNFTTSKQVLRPGPISASVLSGDGQALISWKAAPDATAYHVYRRLDGDKEFTKITTDPTKNTSFTDPAAPNGKVVRYIVTGLVGTEETAGSLQAVGNPNPAITIGGKPFFSQNIDTKSSGSTTVNGQNELVITAAGGGIARGDWGGGYDSFRFVATQLDTDFTMTVQVKEKPTNDVQRSPEHGELQNGGVGIMIREGLSPTARFALIRSTIGNGINFRARSEAGAGPDISEDGTDNDGTKYPVYLRLQRAGGVVRGFQSADGKTFTQVGGDVTLSGLAGPIFVGFAATDGFETFNSTTKIDLPSVELK